MFCIFNFPYLSHFYLDAMKFNTLQEVAFSEVVDTFNHAFSDYTVPLNVTVAALQQRCQEEDLDLEISTGAFGEKGELLGFMLHGKREIDGEKVAYNGGTGVIPPARGQALTQAQYRWLLPRLQQAGFSSVRLEVIENNHAAVHVYQKLGFKVVREVDCWKGEIAPGQRKVEIRPLNQLDWGQVQQWWETRPTWQNESQTVENGKKSTLLLGAWEGEELQGYVAAKKNGRVMQCAVAPTARRRGIARTLLSEVQSQIGHPLAFINVDTQAQSPSALLQGLGCKTTIRQLEMEMRL